MADARLDEYRRRLLGRYREQVTTYADHLASVGAGAILTPIKPGEWSAHQVLFHTLATDERAYGPRLRRILREDRPDLEDFDSDRWMAENYDSNEPAQSLLSRWRSVRDMYADEVAAAPAEAWGRTGRQPFWGERTLQWWVERAVAHAEDHWQQLHGA